VPLSQRNLIPLESSKYFVEALVDRATNHEAAAPKALRQLEQAPAWRLKQELQNIGIQYSHYSQGFTKYLIDVMSNLNCAALRAKLRQNLMEELGNPLSPNKEEWPHTDLFDLFLSEVGVTLPCRSIQKIGAAAKLWRQSFTRLCNFEGGRVGIGAIGIGTELIAPLNYRFMLNALGQLEDIGEDGTLFFKLHVEADQIHAEELLEITAELADSTDGRKEIRYGVSQALSLRATFWDSLSK
jgi:pyrroloquinoline-quinone synthase